MPAGNPEAYMQMGMPPEEAMMMAGPPPGPGGPPMMDPMMGGAPPMMGPDPMMGGGMMPPPVDPMEMLLAAVMGKWDSQEAQMAGEQMLLMDTLAQIASAQAPSPADSFAEGAPIGGDMMPMEDEMPMGGTTVPSVSF